MMIANDVPEKFKNLDFFLYHIGLITIRITRIRYYYMNLAPEKKNLNYVICIGKSRIYAHTG